MSASVRRALTVGGLFILSGFLPLLCRRNDFACPLWVTGALMLAAGVFAVRWRADLAEVGNYGRPEWWKLSPRRGRLVATVWGVGVGAIGGLILAGGIASLFVS